MIGYTTIGTKNLAKAQGFYNELLALVGGKELMGLCLLYTPPSPRD